MSVPFRPTGATVTASASTTSTAEQALGGEQPRYSLRIYNATSAIAFVRFGATGMAAATSADIPVAPGAVEIWTLTADQAFARVILASGTGSVYFTPGQMGTL